MIQVLMYILVSQAQTRRRECFIIIFVVLKYDAGHYHVLICKLYRAKFFVMHSCVSGVVIVLR